MPSTDRAPSAAPAPVVRPTTVGPSRFRTRARAALPVLTAASAVALAVPLLVPPAVAATPATAPGAPVGSLAAPGGLDLTGSLAAAGPRGEHGAALVRPDRAEGAGGERRGLLRDGTVRRTGRLAEVVADESATTPTAAQRVAAIDVTIEYGAKRLTAVVRHAAVPTAADQSVTYLYAGEMWGSTCEPHVGIAANGYSNDSRGAFLDGTGDQVVETGPVPVSRTRSGSAVTLRATHASIGSADWDCAYAAVRPVGAADGEYFHGLRAERLTDHYVPVLSMDPGSPMQGNYAGRWTKLRLEVGNSGAIPARGLKVTLKGKGLKFKRKTRKLGTLGNGRTKYGVVFKVKRKGKAKKPRKLRITATATNGGRTTEVVRIAQKPRPTKPRSLVGRYYWSTKSVPGRGWTNSGLMFVNRNWVYRGFPAKGVPKCSAKVKACKRYSYSPRSGTVRFAGERGKVTTESLVLGKGNSRAYHYPLTLPRKGSRYTLRLMRQDFNGCQLFGSCYTWTERIELRKNGRFVRSRSSLSSFGYIGGPTSYFSNFPPDERGKYRVLSKGRIRFSYASGRTQVQTIGIEHDVRGKPSPKGEGLLLGGANFYR